VKVVVESVPAEPEAMFSIDSVHGGFSDPSSVIGLPGNGGSIRLRIHREAIARELRRGASRLAPGRSRGFEIRPQHPQEVHWQKLI
jgi:hypothetical protein